MAQAVKFYSVASLPTRLSDGAIYFVQEAGKTYGELYKGSVRFGAGRVSQVSSSTDLSSPTVLADKVRGDIAICDQGGTFVYDGTNWKALGPDMQNLFSSSTSFGGEDGDIVTKITQNKDGSVTAETTTFATLAGDLESRVSDLETWEGNITGSAIVAGTVVRAETAQFKNLTVDEVATFSATTLNADTLSVATENGLTLGGSTVADIAKREIGTSISALSGFSNASDKGVTVSVTTSGGEVTQVNVGVEVATSISSSTSDALVTEGVVQQYVEGKLESFDNAMHFAGAGTTLPTTHAEGDIYVFTADATDSSGYKAGQEVIYTESGWEVIGDQNTYAVNAYEKENSATMTGVTTVSGALDALAGAVDTLKGADTVDGSVAKALKDAKDYTDTQIGALEGEAEGKDAETDTSLTVKVESSDGEVDGVTVTLNKATTINAATATGTEGQDGYVPAASDANLATEKAVRTAIDNAISDATMCWYDENDNAIEETPA